MPIQEAFVTINLQIKTEKDNEMHKAVLQINSLLTGKLLIKESVKIFNELFKNEKINKFLKENFDNYELRKSKKSGKPDYDLPSKFF